MTLLEALAALVILGVSAVGYLELFHHAGRSATDAEQWGEAATLAESALDAATLDERSSEMASPAGVQARIARRDWNAVAGVREIVVTVTTPRGVTLEVHRLTRASR